MNTYIGMVPHIVSGLNTELQISFDSSHAMKNTSHF